jgi:glycerol uptake facilitator-like aquaporin
MTESNTATTSVKQKLLLIAFEWGLALLLAMLLLMSAGVEVSSANPLRPEFFAWSVLLLLVICVWFFQKICALCSRWFWPVMKITTEKPL